jgi:hypothetical protein
MRVCVRELDAMFSSIDPSPLAERDLADETEHFIVSWARDLPNVPLSLSVELGRPSRLPDPGPAVRDAVHMFFGRRAETAGRELRTMFRRGRVSLVIGLLFLTACVLTGDFLGHHIRDGGLASVLREGLTVAGWVAMWRPMEIFLYNWWPLASDRRLYARLARMPVTVTAAGDDPGRVDPDPAPRDRAARTVTTVATHGA